MHLYTGAYTGAPRARFAKGKEGDANNDPVVHCTNWSEHGSRHTKRRFLIGQTYANVSRIRARQTTDELRTDADVIGLLGGGKNTQHV